MSSRLAMLLVCSALASPVLSIPRAHAGDANRSLEPGAPEVANQRYRIGIQLYLEGRFEEAAREFEAAQAMFPRSVKLAYNGARAFERAGLIEKAVDRYERYIELAPKAADRGEVEKLVAVLRQRLMASRPKLTIASTPAGAQVFLDAEKSSAVGTTPFEFRVKPGAHLLRFELEGYGTEIREFEATRGKSQVVNVELTPQAPSKPPPGATVQTPVEPASTTDWQTYAGWTAIGFGVVAAGYGTYSWQETNDIVDQVNDPDESKTRDELKTEYDDAWWASAVGYGLGAALITGGVFLLLSDADSSQSASQSGFVPGATTLTWRF